MNCEGKNKRRGMTFGKTAATKKAIVQLTEESKEIEKSRRSVERECGYACTCIRRHTVRFKPSGLLLLSANQARQ